MMATTMDAAIDSHAREIATEARAAARSVGQRIDDHIRNCEELGRENKARLGVIETKLDSGAAEARGSIGRVHGRIDKLLWATIAGFGATILALATLLVNMAGVVK